MAEGTNIITPPPCGFLEKYIPLNIDKICDFLKLFMKDLELLNKNKNQVYLMKNVTSFKLHGEGWRKMLKV